MRYDPEHAAKMRKAEEEAFRGRQSGGSGLGLAIGRVLMVPVALFAGLALLVGGLWLFWIAFAFVISIIDRVF